jgi:hypothetical protein
VTKSTLLIANQVIPVTILPDGRRLIAEADFAKLMAHIEKEEARRDAQRQWLGPGG